MTKKNLIGFCGFVNPEIVKKYKFQYPNSSWVDLDIDFQSPDYKILPDIYCKIIKNIVNNAIFFKDKLILIIISVGREKCDSALFASYILKQLGFCVVESVYEKPQSAQVPKISTSNLPLRKKFELITKNIVEETTDLQFEQCKPKFGFWGVPPNDLSILELFPDETHVYGWTRCVDAKTPFDLELEMFVDENVPTVFYAQAFCAKSQLAKYLSFKYNGLYIDIDDFATQSVKAKLEAFIKLR